MITFCPCLHITHNQSYIIIYLFYSIFHDTFSVNQNLQRRMKEFQVFLFVSLFIYLRIIIYSLFYNALTVIKIT